MIIIWAVSTKPTGVEGWSQGVVPGWNLGEWIANIHSFVGSCKYLVRCATLYCRISCRWWFRPLLFIISPTFNWLNGKSIMCLVKRNSEMAWVREYNAPYIHDRLALVKEITELIVVHMVKDYDRMRKFFHLRVVMRNGFSCLTLGYVWYSW